MLHYSPMRFSTCYNRKGQQEEFMIANLLYRTVNSRQLSHVIVQQEVSCFCINQAAELVSRLTDFIFHGILK